MALKTQYQYIHFEKVADKPRTSVWSCRNNRSGGELGTIRWYYQWRQYCYFPTAQAVYSVGCLADIQAFVVALANAQKEK